MGCATQIWWGGGGPPSHATVRLDAEGHAFVVTGIQDIGTGTLTGAQIVAAEELGLPLDHVRVVGGDTGPNVYGPVAGGSQTTPSVMPAVRSASAKVRKTLLQLAGDVFEIAAADLEVSDGRIRSRDGAIDVDVTEVTEKLGNATIDGSGSRGPNPDGFVVHTFGCQIAQVAVDPGLGEVRVERIVAVHDVGRIVNPLTASSQVEGGILQGMAFALSEELVIDPTTGVPVNAHLDDYKIPTIADVPGDRDRLPARRRREPAERRREGARRAADRPDGSGDRQCVRACDGPPSSGAPTDARPVAGDAGVSGYARPTRSRRRSSCSRATALPSSPVAPTSQARSIAASAPRRSSSISRRRGSAESRPTVTAFGSEPRRRSPTLASPSSWRRTQQLRPPPASRPRRSSATRARWAATSASTRAAGTTAARSGRAGSAAATRATRRSATIASTTSRRGTASRPIPPISRRRSRCAAPPSSCARSSGERELPLLELYRRPTDDNRSLVTLAVGEIVVAVRLPAPPDVSVYLRTGERQAFSFPLVSVAAARTGDALTLAAAGVANIPRALDPADPLAGLPGHPQSAWKRTVLATLVERALGRRLPSTASR